MHLSLQTDFALRILMALGTSGQQMSVEEISRRYNVSRNHLAKVAHRLQTLGLVKATRGRGGGLSLARPPEDINVGEVVRAMENLGNFVECMQASSNGCPVVGACGLQGALTRALQDFLATSGSVSTVRPDTKSAAVRGPAGRGRQLGEA